MRLKLITGAGVHGSLSMFVRSDGAAASKQSPLSDLAGDRCGVNSACRAILALVGGNESFVCGGGGRRRSAHPSSPSCRVFIRRTNDKVYNEYEKKRKINLAQLSMC